MDKQIAQIFLGLGLFVKILPKGGYSEFQVGSIDFLPDEVVDRTMQESKTAFKNFVKSRGLNLATLVDDDAFSYVGKVRELTDGDFLAAVKSEFCPVAELYPEGGVLIPLEDVQSLASLISQEKEKLKNLFLDGMSTAISQNLLSDSTTFTESYNTNTDTYLFTFSV